MVEGLIEKKENNYKKILDLRKQISELKQQKAIEKSPLWGMATGTVDAKKDYIKSMLADKDNEIRLAEAEIEYNYNIIKTIDDRLEYLTNE